MTLWWLSYPLLGIFAGFVAGLFGVGGGLTIVPVLIMVFSAQGFPQQHLVHLALGTAFATIVFTSMSSMSAHARHGAVRWNIVKTFAPGLITGTLVGSLFAGTVPTRPLGVIFAIVVTYASSQMIFDFKPKPHRSLPGTVVLFGVGIVFGFLSSLVAAGGGFLNIPYMLFCNVPVRETLGTSSALGFPIALTGAIGYIISGWHASNLPAYSFSYVYLPAFFGILLFSIAMAPVGAKLTHSLPVGPLKRALGVFLAILAIKMVYSLFT